MSGKKKIRIFADGVFDSFHIGHSNMLRQCKEELFPDNEVYLIAGINDQKDIEKYKGSCSLKYRANYLLRKGENCDGKTKQICR